MRTTRGRQALVRPSHHGEEAPSRASRGATARTPCSSGCLSYSENLFATDVAVDSLYSALAHPRRRRRGVGESGIKNQGSPRSSCLPEVHALRRVRPVTARRRRRRSHPPDPRAWPAAPALPPIYPRAGRYEHGAARTSHPQPPGPHCAPSRSLASRTAISACRTA